MRCIKIENIRLLRESDKSFIVYRETNPFSPWHRHPEYELVLITKGRGKRMVGDRIGRFEENDLVFIGSNTPHEWLCDPEYFPPSGGFLGEGIVVQFLYDFPGKEFFGVPENSLNISTIVYQSGFENISNFNRQFKKIRGITPSRFLKEVHSIEKK